jgi:hypothetical protein
MDDFSVNGGLFSRIGPMRRDQEQKIEEGYQGILLTIQFISAGRTPTLVILYIGIATKRWRSSRVL